MLMQRDREILERKTVAMLKKRNFKKHFTSFIKVSWCSWLSRQSNTLKVSGSNPGDAIFAATPFLQRVEEGENFRN